MSDFNQGKSLGEGKFGVVYQASHKTTGFLYAIKKVPKDMIKSHLMVDQFILELKLQTFLNHQNILALYGHFDDDSHIYLILEYMEEGTLFTHLKKNKVLPEKDVAVSIRQIASAVKYLHENNIAHRDIKPENIVMSHVPLSLSRAFANCVTSVGLQFAMIAGKLTVGHSTMRRQKS